MLFEGKEYPIQRPEDLIITKFVVGDNVQDLIKKKIEKDRIECDRNLGYIHHYSGENFPADEYLFVKKYEIGDKVNLFKCFLNLHLFYDFSFKQKDENQTFKNVVRFYNILKILLSKNIRAERSYPEKVTNICAESFYVHQKYTNFKEETGIDHWIDILLNNRINICLNRDRLYITIKPSDIPLKERLEMRTPTFTIPELLENDLAYQKFLDFWNEQSDYNSLITILNKLTKNKDVSEKILKKAIQINISAVLHA
jgi:hypothetical protein